MLKSYLPPKFNTWFIITQIVALMLGAVNIFIALICFHLFFYFLLRKKPNRFRDDPVTTAGVVFAPCNGKVISFTTIDDKIELVMSLLPWKEMGIFLPITCEIINLTRMNGEVHLELSNKSDLISLHFSKRILGFEPDLIIMPGDQGVRRVNIGYFPMGGKVVLYLPKKYEILVTDLNEVIACETIIAVLPEKQ